MNDMKGKRVLVTGSGTGLGQEVSTLSSVTALSVCAVHGQQKFRKRGTSEREGHFFRCPVQSLHRSRRWSGESSATTGAAGEVFWASQSSSRLT